MSDKELVLSNGVKMPIIGFGTFQHTPLTVTESLVAAVKAGYRHIDTCSEFKNEPAVGRAIRQLIKKGVVKREELFITTKISINRITHGSLENNLRISLRRLHLKYVDLYLVHIPTTFDNPKGTIYPIVDVWRQLDALYKKKLTRAIGGSNWRMEHLEKATSLGITPIHVAQIEFHLSFIQHAYWIICSAAKVCLISYDTLGLPGRFHFSQLTGVYSPWKQLPSEVDHPVVIELAKKYNKTPNQILLRFVLDHRVAIIPKSCTNRRIEENINIFDFFITEVELSKLERNKFFKPDHPFYHIVN
uniref:Aldo_ket_red domain-containing protein n=1 Tax=Caenorhabditis tropicalis TaxID=1561998 RepID=A0A1I7TWI1_9PELO